MSDDVSARLSSKLLQGWCMLDASCDVCNTPIMRDKQKKDYCCGCQKFLGKAEEVKIVKEEVKEGVREEARNGELKDRIEKCAGRIVDRINASNNIEDCAKDTENLLKVSQAYMNFGFK